MQYNVFSKDSEPSHHSFVFHAAQVGVCSMHYAALVGVYAVYFVAERDCFLFVNIESILPPSSLVQMCFVFISYGSLQWVAFECITVQFIYKCKKHCNSGSNMFFVLQCNGWYSNSAYYMQV